MQARVCGPERDGDCRIIRPYRPFWGKITWRDGEIKFPQSRTSENIDLNSVRINGVRLGNIEIKQRIHSDYRGGLIVGLQLIEPVINPKTCFSH